VRPESPDIDRLLKVLRREGEPDRVPFYEHFADQEFVEAVTGTSFPKVDAPQGPGSSSYFEVLVEFYTRLGFDYVPFEVALNLPSSNTLETADTAHLSRGVRTWRDEQRGTIEKIEDFEAYPWPEPREAADLTQFENLRRALPDGMGIVGGVAGGVFEHVSWLMGLANASKAVHTDRRLIGAMFEKVGSLILAVDREVVRAGYVDALRMGDDLGYRDGTFIAPKFLRKYVFPWYEELVHLSHANGLPFVLHSCGNLYRPDETGKSVMDYLVDEVRIDAKHSYEDTIMPVTEAKARYGGRVAVLGGVDLDKLVRFPEADLRSYVKGILAGCAPGGGYALGTGNSVTNYVPIDNYLAMLDEGRRYGRPSLR